MSLDRTFSWADDPSFDRMLDGLTDLHHEIAALRLVRVRVCLF